ncbi:anti-CBASS protein Acb1 family protein [Methylobacterium tarhaniae]|uniref:anti-CBASS protein Acb1 family protein n=1 Tax=Methylobacterium tarhaniae TaxID=1187852 RepID=UPI003D049A1A
MDSFRNLLSGLGTAKDKTVANQHIFVPRSLMECRSAYRGNWIARKVVDIVPFDMLREWRAWQADPKQVEAIEAAERALGLQGKLLDALKRARLEGGSAIVIGDGGNATTPLLPADLAQGGIKWLHVFGRDEIQPGEPILDPYSPWFGEPVAWQLTSQREGAVQIHPSRVVRFVGAPILDTVSSQAEQGWGDSVLQALFDALDQATSSPAYLAALLPEAKQDIVSVPGLANWLKTSASTAELTKRFQYAAQMKSSLNMLLLDGDGKSATGEIFQQKQINFSGLPDVVKLFLMIAAGAADIPATRLLGQSPQGMNATGDSDTRNYYDRCASGQKVELTPQIARLDELLIVHALGSRPDSVWYQWNPLYQPTQKEKADTFKVLADGVKVLADASLAPKEILARGTKGMVTDAGLFPGIDTAYDEHGDDPLTEAPVEADQYDPYGYPAEGYTGTDDPGNVIPFPGRAALGDAAPRTLYVSRKLKNGDDLLAWARSQGFADLMPAGELHVTIAYSRTAIDWMKVGQTWNGEELKIAAGGPRLVERFGEATVLLFASDELRWRHQEIREAGASWDHPEYQPHVTFTWNAGDVDVAEVEPYNGPLVFGPEIFEPVDEGWRASLTTDADPLDEEDEDETAAVTDDEIAALFGEEYRKIAEADRQMRDAFPDLVAFLDARRPRHGGGAPRRPFDESKVHRVGGRFASKGGTGEPTAPRPPRQTVGARHLEEHNVGGDHGIVVNSARVRKYRGHDSVESFVAAHPKGRAHALRTLAADHKAGRISFAAAAPKVEAPKPAPAKPAAPKPAPAAPKPAPKPAEPDDPLAALERALAAPKPAAAPAPKPAPARQAPKPEPSKPAPAPHEGGEDAPTPRESRVLKAIQEAQAESDSSSPLVGLQAVRNRLPDLSRKEIDEAMFELQFKGLANMTGIADPKHPAVRRGEGTDFGGGRRDEIALTMSGAEHLKTKKG